MELSLRSKQRLNVVGHHRLLALLALFLHLLQLLKHLFLLLLSQKILLHHLQLTGPLEDKPTMQRILLSLHQHLKLPRHLLPLPLA